MKPKRKLMRNFFLGFPPYFLEADLVIQKAKQNFIWVKWNKIYS
ncbi:hypothetical protein P872_03250 [Rhodonellum psychrophilum GCM71 = DSM 17998]|uniref:Uncharacterized protein n=1 Tax=Rhodonellum psychrophilum GCM71 = DSM 17998 TaxID=1123057 RepID=U5C011_9BACT|nr:hypothetical protein P872_03250 [Rhodonellum psychrophilum GCM71 = DSM 17998]